MRRTLNMVSEFPRPGWQNRTMLGPTFWGNVSLERTILALTRSNGAFILSITRFRHFAACLLNPAPGNQAGTYFTLVE
jgi:hypothetical protein